MSMPSVDFRHQASTLMDLLTDDAKRRAVELFLTCGKSSVTEGSGSQFIEKLVE